MAKKTAADYITARLRRGELTYDDLANFVRAFQICATFDLDQRDGKPGPKTLTALKSQLVQWKATGALPTTPVALPGVAPLPTPQKSTFSGWVYPMPALADGTKPGISSRYSKNGSGPNRYRKNHWGVDVMYRRHPDDGGPRNSQKNLRDHPTYTRNWYCPHGIDVLTVGPGSVRKIRTGRNNSVEIDHGEIDGYGRIITWYQHLHDVLVELGDTVDAADVIGLVGPGSTGVRHLHLELWMLRRGRGRAAAVVDPEPFISGMPLAG